MKNAFYTCMTGPDAGYVPDIRALDHSHFDFYVFHDAFHGDFPGWHSINIETDCPAQATQFGHKQRWVKTMPHLYLSNYAYSVYLDPKFELTNAFLHLCQGLIEERPGWLAVVHPTRTSFYEEIMFAFSNGILSLEECKRVIDLLAQENVAFTRFRTSLCGWIIRRHNLTNRKIGQRWFQLITKCFANHVRDQIVFPFALHSDKVVDFDLRTAMMKECGVKLNYPNQARTRNVDWKGGAPELLSYIQQRTRLPLPPSN